MDPSPSGTDDASLPALPLDAELELSLESEMNGASSHVPARVVRVFPPLVSMRTTHLNLSEFAKYFEQKSIIEYHGIPPVYNITLPLSIDVPYNSSLFASLIRANVAVL